VLPDAGDALRWWYIAEMLRDELFAALHTLPDEGL
jgi:hypothetical protein